MKKKGLFAALLLVLTLFLSLGVSAMYAEISEFSSKSTYKPVSYSSHKSVSSVTLYGNVDYLCMKAYKDTVAEQVFVLEIYSDSKRTKMVTEYREDYYKGTKYDNILFDLTGLKSKTYYATAYVEKENSRHWGGGRQKDPSTVINFKIVVKRDGTELKDMKTIIYGYENSVEGPIIYWYSVPGATKYYVYKKVDGKFKKIKTVKAAGGDMSYYVDKSLKDKNATAYYKVKAVSGTGSTPLSADELKVNAIKTPKVTLEYNVKDGIKVSWDKVANNVTYYVYAATANSDWDLVEKTSKRSYVHSSSDWINGSPMKSGTVYFFTVIAEKNYVASGYENNKAILYFENPEIKSIKEDSGNLTLSWKAVKSVESYNVYRKISNSKEWIKIGSTKDSTFTDRAVKRNIKYDYHVKSVIGSYESIYSAYSYSEAILDVPVITSFTTDGQGYPVITWNKIDGVSYRIFRKYENSEVWWEVGNTNGTSYTDKKNIENGNKYSYAVCASIGYYYGDKSSPTKITTCYLPIENAMPSPLEEGGVRLKWKKINNVQGYNIYRKSDNEEYYFLGFTDTDCFNDSNLITDVNYTYKIVCVADGAEKETTTKEVPVKLSSKYVTVEANTVETDEPYYCSVKVSNFDSSVKYMVYTRKDGVWLAVNSYITKDGKLHFEKNKDTYLNEYAVASVSPDGTVTFVSSENSFAVKHTVPTELTVEPDHPNYAATLSWKPKEGATKYVIYQDGTQIAVLDNTKTSYTVRNLKPLIYYDYYVGVVADSTEIQSNCCTIRLIKKPDIKSESQDKGLHITWDYCGNNKYTVYRKDTPDGKWKVLKTVQGHSYTDKTAVHGKSYYYTVQCEGGGKKEKGTKATYIKPVIITIPKINKKSLDLKWEKSPVADCYMVYKKIDGKWKKVYTTKDGKTVKYTDKDVKVGEKYAYRVYAVKDGTKSNYAARKVSFIATPTNLKATPSTTSIKLTWNKVTGAEKYQVYYWSKSNKKDKKSFKTTKNSVTLKNLKKATGYKIEIVAIKGKNRSLFSSELSTATVPAKVTLSGLTAGSKQLTAAWKTVSGVTGYEIQYSTSSKFSKKTTKKVTVKSSKTKKTTIKKLIKGKQYYVRVRAYKTINKKSVYGAWSSAKSLKVK